MLPRPDPRRAASNARSESDACPKSNLIDQYTALVLAIFIDAGLVEVGRLTLFQTTIVRLTHLPTGYYSASGGGDLSVDEKGNSSAR